VPPSGAFADNAASLRLSEKLGYRADGANTFARRGTAATEIRLVLQPEHFVRPDWTLQVDGLDGCLQMLGGLISSRLLLGAPLAPGPLLEITTAKLDSKLC
jgi:hypothetical protein